MSRILVVDDKEMMRDSVATLLGRRGHGVVVASGGEQALEKVAARRPDVVVTDLQMPGMNGLELLEAIRAIDDALPVIFMTAYGTIETAVQAMRDGAYDYVTKPFSGEELELTVERALAHASLLRENQVLKATVQADQNEGGTTQMVGSSARMTDLKDGLMLVAESHSTVLINGESGTGKEVAARMIHEASPRSGAPFLAVNCAALSPSLLESELFGHEKGAFTGADKMRKGRFELADGGTLLLDEISEMPLELQAKLLRVLQEQSFERVGSSRTQTVDVRVLATTNRNLEQEVDAGRFRGDLFFRLNVLPFTMPPLRDRAEDVEDLGAYFFGLVAAREGRPARSFSSGALEVLKGYAWPGNVREFQNICERAAVLSRTEVIESDLITPWLVGGDLPAATAEAATSSVVGGVVVPAAPSPSDIASANEEAVEEALIGTDVSRMRRFMACDGRLTLADIEREAILATLEANRGHRQKSARALGIGVRTLGMKLKRWKEEQLVPEAT
ncbi:MAG: sigma-54 dependent transcriptional regulator [Planctomycetota bacterium]|nr:sigma-54 dependent transcriptional regulator [Planctomycetota bacterium]